MAEMKRIAMITGSFDPVTSGHTDLIRRAAKLFDFVCVALMSNGEKDSSGGGMFTYEERLSMLEAACADLAREGITNVKAELCVGLSSAYAAERGITYIVRGVRCASDFDYEYSLAAIMKRFDSDLETVMLPSDSSIACVSSTYVRELIKYHHPIGDAMPESAAALAVEYYGKR
ncbi:MAG: pantetheine-phosphate adenylyltransferase [Clostridia bacterium]|nr:pantetheine-phosphate adenylyltransferase [Clostridia bacterium]